MWATRRARRCYSRGEVTPAGVNCVGVLVGGWDSVLTLFGIPKNANQQQHYHQEHRDRPGDVTPSGVGGPLTKNALTSRAHQRHTSHFLSTLGALYE